MNLTHNDVYNASTDIINGSLEKENYFFKLQNVPSSLTSPNAAWFKFIPVFI